MLNQIQIRQATHVDYYELGQLMFDAVRNGPSAYTELQRAAWVSQPRNGPDWTARLDGQVVYVAESLDQVAGFMSLAKEGYIDFAYIRPQNRGSGLFRMLYEKIETLASANHFGQLWVHASLNAQPAFAAMGFTVSRKESVRIGDQTLDRFEMQKRLGCNEAESSNGK